MNANAPTVYPPDLPGRFAFVIAALLRACGPHIVKDRTAGPWLLAVWHRMNAISQRIQRLAEQIRSGTVPPLRAGFKLTKPRKPPTRPAIVLPSHPWWLVQVIQPTAVYGVWLQQLLDDPQMPEFLAAAPQLARILRPLCRALGVAPPPLPPRPKRPAAPDPSPACPAPVAGLVCAGPQGCTASGHPAGVAQAADPCSPGRPSHAIATRAASTRAMPARAGPRLKPA